MPDSHEIEKALRTAGWILIAAIFGLIAIAFGIGALIF